MNMLHRSEAFESDRATVFVLSMHNFCVAFEVCRLERALMFEISLVV